MDFVALKGLLEQVTTHKCVISIEILWKRPPCGDCVDGVSESRGEWVNEFDMPRAPEKGDKVYVGGVVVDIDSVIWQADTKIWSLSAGSITYTVDYELNTALDALEGSTWRKM